MPEIAPLLTPYHQDWILPSSDAKITLESESTMRISCPGIGFQHEDLSAKQFWTTKYVLTNLTTSLMALIDILVRYTKVRKMTEKGAIFK